MVRGPSPLLTVVLAATALVASLVVPALPDGGGGTAVRAAGVLGAVLLGATVLSAAWLHGGPLILAALLAGSVLLALSIDAADARAAASLPEALAWGTAGMLFARRFDGGAVVLGTCLLVGGLALAGLTGDTSSLTDRAGAGDPLTLEIGAFGGGQALALPALVFVVLGALGTWGAALGLRGTWTAVLVLEALALAAALRVDPVAPVIAAFVVINADRLAAAVRLE